MTAGNAAGTDLSEKTIADLWFQDDEAFLEPLGGPILFAGIFSIAAVGILFAGRRIEGLRMRFFQLLILLLLSAGTSVAAVLQFSSFGREPQIFHRKLDFLITGNTGSSRLVSRVRFVSSGSDLLEWVLPREGILTLPDRGDINIVPGSAGMKVKDLKVEPWKSLDLVLSSTISGYRQTESEAGVIRHNGMQTWYDVVLIDSGAAFLLASEWKPGEQVLLPRIPVLGNSPFPRVSDQEFSRFLERLLGSVELPDGQILAHDNDGTIIVHRGADQ
jgi:hypothetical protein